MAAASMYLGVLEAIFGFLVKIFANIIMFLLETIIGLLSGVLYSIGGTLLSVVDFIQSLFRKFAGIESIWYNGTATGENTDILLYIISEKTVLQVFMALVLVSVALLLMGTIVKIIQNEYTTEGSANSKGTIVGSAIKGLFMFIIVPIGVFGGLYASNFILQAIDRATNPSSSGQLGGAVFTASTTEANRFITELDKVWTISNGEEDSTPWGTWLSGAGVLDVTNFKENTSDGYKLYEAMTKAGYSINSTSTGTEAAQQAASIIDEWFATGASFTTITNGDATTWNEFHDAYAAFVTGNNNLVDSSLTSFDYTSTDQVQTFYRLRDVNFLILYAGGILAAYCMLTAIFGLINRIIKGVIYFMLAPISISKYPFDNGSAFNGWKSTFFKNAIAAYGTVVALNLLFVILPILKNIQLFEPNSVTNRTYNGYVFMLLTLCCLLFFKSAPGLVSGLFGGDDATKEGSDAFKKIGGAAIGMATGGAKLIGNRALAAKSGISARMHEKKSETAGISDEERDHQKDLAKKASDKQVARHTKAKEAGAGIRTKAVNLFNDVSGFSDATGGNWKPKDDKARLEASQRRADRLNAAGASVAGAWGTHTRREAERGGLDWKQVKNTAKTAGKTQKEVREALNSGTPGSLGDFKKTDVYESLNKRANDKKLSDDERQAARDAMKEGSKTVRRSAAKRKPTAEQVKAFTGLGAGLSGAGAEIGFGIPGVSSVLQAAADYQAVKKDKKGKEAVEANATLVQNFNVDMKKAEVGQQQAEFKKALSSATVTKAMAETVATKLLTSMKEQATLEAKILQDKLGKLDLAKDSKDIEKLKKEIEKLNADLKKNLEKVADDLAAKP